MPFNIFSAAKQETYFQLGVEKSGCFNAAAASAAALLLLPLGGRTGSTGGCATGAYVPSGLLYLHESAHVPYADIMIHSPSPVLDRSSTPRGRLNVIFERAKREASPRYFVPFWRQGARCML